MIQRMFGHTALSANFLILAGLCLFAYRDKYKNSFKKKIIWWTLLLLISATIHLYYIPMVVIIMFCTFIIEFIEDKKTYKKSIFTFIFACIIAIIAIYVLGGFTNGNYEKEGLNEYNINLNTFINPQGYSRFLKDLKTATYGEYEALGYLGFGILLMCFLWVIFIIIKYSQKKNMKITKNPNIIFGILCIFLGMLLAMRNKSKIWWTYTIWNTISKISIEDFRNI